MSKAPLAALALILAALPALAGPREETLAGISRCADLPDDRTFLDCLYGAAQPMRARLGLTPAPQGQVRLVPPAYVASSVPPSSVPVPSAYGPPPPRTSALENVLGGNTVPGWLETFSFDEHGLFTTTLSNGEIWRQDPSDRARAHWRGRASDYGIKLVKDAGGRSGQLVVRGDATPYLVRRLR